MFLIS